MSAISIDIGVGGLNTALARMERMVTNGKQFKALMDGMTQRSAGSSGGSGGGGSSSGGGSNPLVRLQNAQVALQKAMSGGSAVQVFGAQYQQALAQKAMQRAQATIAGGPGFGQRLMQFIGSTRIGLGGGGGVAVMPLVGRLMSLFGASGPVGLAVTAAAAVLTVFAGAVHHAAEALNEIRSAKLTSGASDRTMATLTAMGFSPGEASQAAQRFSNLSASNGYAAFLRSQAGVGQNVGGPYGEQDKAGALEGVLKYIASLSTLEERRKAAMMGELTAYLPLIETYRKHKATIEADAAAMAAVNNDQATSSAADFMFQLGRIGQMFQLIVQAVAGEYLQDWADGLAVVADYLREAAKSYKFFGPVMRVLIDAAFPLIGALDGLMKILAMLKPAVEGFKGSLKFFTDLRGSFLGKIYDGFAAFANAVVPVVFKALDAITNAWIDSLAAMYNALKAIPLFKDLPALGQMPHLDLASVDFKMPSWGEIVDPLVALAGALDRNTDATNQNSKWITYQPGTYGGGAAVRGAVPSKWTKFNRDNQIAIWNAQRLGAFAMG